ncbi:MAG: DNA-binding transcriptional regulator [Verrucomicrobiales bacterium]|nr:DNA-binding transcriptional regulator [Verrucomicrobiales bacterium]
MPTPRRKRIPRVALLIETTRSYTRGMLAGVRRYVAENGPWSTFVELRAPDSPPPPWLARWQGDGILTRTFTPELNKAVTATGLPAVELRSTQLPHQRPFVGIDNSAIGQAVADHFLNRGYRHFALYSLRTEAFFIERIENFSHRLRAAGHSCIELPSSASEKPRDWEQSQQRLMDSLRQLPKPIGIFAATDQLAVHLLDACLRVGLAVPEEVAVVGCENDETLCSLATPPLTSVELDGERVGFEAARLLDRLMSSGKAPMKPTLVPPRGIITRESSDDLVITDALIAQACRIIREQACDGLTVDTLCRRLNTSRSTLERRMKTAIDRTPKEEIQRIRFRDVQRLLTVTDLTLEAIAERTGFVHPHYLQTAFKDRHGLTPGAFRRQRR